MALIRWRFSALRSAFLFPVESWAGTDSAKPEIMTDSIIFFTEIEYVIERKFSQKSIKTAGSLFLDLTIPEGMRPSFPFDV